MASVTVLTADRMLEIEAASIVDGDINAAGHLILNKKDGTTVDVGAVSGMRLQDGAVYAAVDAFSYIGSLDPGAVADGSVWYDTSEPAGPFASETKKGILEIATAAEVAAGTDNSTAVSPAGLASIPGTKVQVVSGFSETAAADTWPVGVSVQSVTSGSGWTPNNGFGMVLSSIISSSRAAQTFYASAGGTNPARTWVRTANASDGGGGWTTWREYQVTTALVTASFTQTTAYTSYPEGTSRLVFTTANSTGWDFSGKAGEVVTYRDGNTFARQVWTRSMGGSTNSPEQWVRTATSAGWTKWLIIAEDTGVNALTLTSASGFALRKACGWRRKNGVVYLEGAFTAPASSTSAWTTVVTLPPEARPKGTSPDADRYFPMSTNSTTNMAARVEASTGVVGVWMSAASGGWASLDGISYPI